MPQIIQFIENIEDEIAVSDKIACYIISDEIPAQKIKETISLGKMVLSCGEKAFDICRDYNLDGVVKKIDVSKPVKSQLKPLREALKKKTLGVIIPARRHEAMLAGEVEPDFMAFYSVNTEQDGAFLSWYNELFLIPAAWQLKDDEDETKDVDFLIVNTKKIKNFGC